MKFLGLNAGKQKCSFDRENANPGQPGTNLKKKKFDIKNGTFLEF